MFATISFVACSISAVSFVLFFPAMLLQTHAQQRFEVLSAGGGFQAALLPGADNLQVVVAYCSMYIQKCKGSLDEWFDERGRVHPRL